jgi:hypothetical protein
MVNRPIDLGDGEVWVEYHPASGKPPELLSSMDIRTPATTALPSKPFDEEVPPWYPFKSRADFEQAELFLRFDVSDPHIDAQLKLMVTDCPLGHSVTMTSAKEFHAILAQIPVLESMPEVRFSCFVCSIFRSDVPSFKLRHLMYSSIAKLLAGTMCDTGPYYHLFLTFSKMS